MIEGLDDECRNCGRIQGDHTLREWDVCVSVLSVDLRHEDVSEDIRKFTERLGFETGVQVADHVVAKSMVMMGTGPVGVTMPMVQLEFQVGTPAGPMEVAKIGYIGTEESVRKFGILIRDTSNGAINAAKRARE